MTAAVVACIGDTPNPTGSDGGDGGGGTDASADGPPAGSPTHPPTSITFHDTNPAKGAISGTIVVGKASDESDVASYALYWGVDAKTKLASGASITTLAKTGADVSYPITGMVPAGATQLLAFSVNAVGELPTNVALPYADNFPRYADVSASTTGAGSTTSVAYDSTNAKLLFVQSDAAGRPGLYRCNPDGAGCTHADISSGHLGISPVLVVDAASSKLLVIAAGPVLFRCNLDGTACTYADISAGQVGSAPKAVIDSKNSKLLVASTMSMASNGLGLFRCNLDGTGCGYVSLSATANSGVEPAVAIDTANSKLVVVTANSIPGSGKPTLFQCNLDGTGCAMKDLSANQPPGSGETPSVAIDSTGAKLLVATCNAANSSRLALFRCDLDGTSCGYTDISAGQPASSGMAPSAHVDATNGKLWVAAISNQVQLLPVIYRVNLDGTGSTFIDMSAGRPATSGEYLSAALDTADARILLIGMEGANNTRKADLFWLGLW